MSSTGIYIKTEEETKNQAQKIAKELGLSLSVVMNRLLKQFIKTKTVNFNVDDEIPNAHSRALMKQAEKNLKKGNHSPVFNTGEEAVIWLEKHGI